MSERPQFTNSPIHQLAKSPTGAVLSGTCDAGESGPFCTVDRPAISVIIPCYNEAKLLPRLLTSIEAARRAFSGGPAGVEVVVADNAPTDGPAAIAGAR